MVLDRISTRAGQLCRIRDRRPTVLVRDRRNLSQAGKPLWRESADGAPSAHPIVRPVSGGFRFLTVRLRGLDATGSCSTNGLAKECHP
jgi:hypothetical protein